MRKIIALLAALLAAGAPLFAQESSGVTAGGESTTGRVEVSGEVRTGLYMEQEKTGILYPTAIGGMTNSDGYSGTGNLLHIDLRYAYGNTGLRTRFWIESGGGNIRPTWSFAYAYGNVFDEQLTISAGLLGESPWGTGGPRLNREPETREYIEENPLSKDVYTKSEGLLGIRFEYKPSFVPGLNIGFVLNQPDQTVTNEIYQKFAEVLGESVVGVAYEHDYFALRVGYRFDSDADYYKDSGNEGGRLGYRLEEKVLNTLVPGMQVWLNGIYYGIGCGEVSTQIAGPDGRPVNIKFGVGEYSVNWLYWQWDTDSFIAKFDTCFSMYQEYTNGRFFPNKRQEYQSLEFQPAFYYKFLGGLLQAGLGLGFGMEFGDGKTYTDSPYQYIYVEPQVRLNIGANTYIALVYNFTDKYAWWQDNVGITVKGVKEGDKSQKHSINLRAVFTF